MVVAAGTAQPDPLRMVTSIPLPNVVGRFDHAAIDLAGQRLFLTGRDANTIEVVDLKIGRHVQTLPGFPQPQGAYYVPFAKKLFVSTRNDGACQILSGDSLEVVGSIKLSMGANVIAYDQKAKYLYIGHGGRQAGDSPSEKRDPGRIAIVNAANGQLVGNIETDPILRPGAIVVEQQGSRLFTTNAMGSEIVIIDRKKKRILEKWALPNSERSGTVALDEGHHRLFVGLRNPSRVIVFDSNSGKQITSFPTVDGIDRLLYDGDNKRLYATGSAKSGDHQGSIEAYRQIDPDHYELIANVPTAVGGGTSFYLKTRTSEGLYVAVPNTSHGGSEILFLAVQE